jgi:hypothetical protein
MSKIHIHARYNVNRHIFLWFVQQNAHINGVQTGAIARVPIVIVVNMGYIRKKVFLIKCRLCSRKMIMLLCCPHPSTPYILPHFVKCRKKKDDTI